MYQAHKREFFRVLEDIESSSKLDIEFDNREKLYRHIFPMNYFSNVELKVTIGDVRRYDLVNFTDIHDSFEKTIDELNICYLHVIQNMLNIKVINQYFFLVQYSIYQINSN